METTSLTNKQILDSIEALSELQKTEAPAVLSFRFAKAIMAVEPLVKAVNAARDKLLEKYAEKDENGNNITSQSEGGGGVMIRLKDPEAFSDEFEVLLQAKNDIHVDKVKISDLGDMTVKPMIFVALDWLFQE